VGLNSEQVAIVHRSGKYDFVFDERPIGQI